jgi:hypothetical protein
MRILTLALGVLIAGSLATAGQAQVMQYGAPGAPAYGAPGAPGYGAPGAPAYYPGYAYDPRYYYGYPGYGYPGYGYPGYGYPGYGYAGYGYAGYGPSIGVFFGGWGGGGHGGWGGGHGGWGGGGHSH